LATIPAWTALYAYKVMTFIQIPGDPPDFMGIPPLPVPFYIASIAWPVFDVLREYNGLVEAKSRISKKDTSDSSRE